MKITIDKNIPPPFEKHKYPWAELEVGDSFFVEGITTSNGIHSSAKYHGIKITARIERTGIRVWRIG